MGYGIFMGYDWYYPLVNVYIATEDHDFFIGKSAISMAQIFNGYVTNYQRVASKLT